MPVQFNQRIIGKEMKIELKDLNTASMTLTKKGMELGFFDNGKHIGDLRIKPAELVWNRGKVSKSGKRISWPEFFKQMQKIQN